MPSWDLKLLPVPSKPGGLGLKTFIVWSTEGPHSLMGMSPEKDHLLTDLHFSRLLQPAAALIGTEGLAEGPLGSVPDLRKWVWGPGVRGDCGPSYFLPMWLDGYGSHGSSLECRVCVTVRPGASTPGLYPGQWKAETRRTFHLDKMNLMRAMENGKPDLGKGNVLFHVKQTNKKCDCGKHPKK